jgi:hypothetical protein
MTSEPSSPDDPSGNPEAPESHEGDPGDAGPTNGAGGGEPTNSSHRREPFIPNLGINDALTASMRDLIRSVMPTLNTLPTFNFVPKIDFTPKFHLNLPATAMPDLGWARLLTPQTDAFLRQIPSLDFSRLITPDLTAGLARIADWIGGFIPENLRDLKFAEWQRLIEISEEQRIGIVWVLRQEVLHSLLDADSEEARGRVLQEESAVILDGCRQSLQATTYEDLADLVRFAEEAIATHRAGHSASAQALATNVLDTALEQHHVGGVSAMHREWKRLRAQDADSSTLLETRLRLATAGIPHSYRDYKYEKRDPRYSRNGTAHAVNTALYTPDNSVRAITLATAWLRWLHETWTEVDRRAGENAA